MKVKYQISGWPRPSVHEWIKTNSSHLVTLNRLVEQGLTSHSTQFRWFRGQCFYRSHDPSNSVKALKEGG